MTALRELRGARYHLRRAVLEAGREDPSSVVVQWLEQVTATVDRIERVLEELEHGAQSSTRPAVSHVDRGQLFGLTADGTMYVEEPLELVAGEVEPHRVELERPAPGTDEVDELRPCPACGRPCFWDYIRGAWRHD